MARFRRVIRPGCLIHIIVRFLNHEYLLDSPEVRAEYLRRAGLSFGASDWRVLSYALMSSHTHFGMVAGRVPFGMLSRSLHAGFAGWLNPRRGRLGPVVASRPHTYEIALEGVGALVAYHHNNPVRARVAASASESDWSSHQAYAGLQPALDWLDVDLGLQLAGFDTSRTGRRAFCALVDALAHADHPRFVPTDLLRTRADLRGAVSSAIELGFPTLDANGNPRSFTLWSTAENKRNFRDLTRRAVATIAASNGVSSDELYTKSRRRPVSRVRRISVLCCRCYLGIPLHLVAAHLHISAQAAQQLEKSAAPDDHREAKRLARLVARPSLDDPSSCIGTDGALDDLLAGAARCQSQES